MSNPIKAIIARLTAAKVSEDDLARTRELIDEAPDDDAKLAAEVASVAAYVCGVGKAAPRLTAAFKQDHAHELLWGLSKSPAWDAWDQRALDVLVQARESVYFWQLLRWARTLIAEHPDEAVCEQVIDAFKTRKLWRSDDDVIDA